MKMIKRTRIASFTTFFLLIVCGALFLAGCDNGQQQSTNSPAASSAPAVGEAAPSADSASPETPSHLEQIRAAGKLVVAAATWRPLVFYDESGKLSGYNVDLVQQVADKIGVELEWLDIPFASLVAAVRTGRCDMGVGSISNTTQGGDTVSFSDGYLENPTGIVTLEINNEITGLDSLRGKRFGYNAATNHEVMALALVDQYGFEPVGYEQIEDMLLDLQNRRIDAGMNTVISQNAWNREHPGVIKVVGDYLRTTHISVVFQKDDTTLRTLVNELIQENIDNGTAEELYKKWME